MSNDSRQSRDHLAIRGSSKETVSFLRSQMRRWGVLGVAPDSGSDAQKFFFVIRMARLEKIEMTSLLVT